MCTHLAHLELESVLVIIIILKNDNVHMLICTRLATGTAVCWTMVGLSREGQRRRL